MNENKFNMLTKKSAFTIPNPKSHRIKSSTYRALSVLAPLLRRIAPILMILLAYNDIDSSNPLWINLLIKLFSLLILLKRK